ncbi:unnamed protein product [Clavelina lepadiformis]|uniref:GATOR2 complex protein WDR24 n=1 Tax=Clavelina lepadiformis TaxID=159417 RepID=A0ABP0EYZ6_CLALP
MELINADYQKKTTHVNVGGAANALSVCRDNSKVIVAGRSLLKIFSVDENTGQFKEFKNLHIGRKQGLNMSSADVAWCQNDEMLIVTAATNGAIVAWDLAAMNRNKQFVVLSEHRRTVTKVSFHPHESSRIISGSQDGTMKMFDVRKKECLCTFDSKADGVRCVQFSPYNHFQFAASFDNGNVQIWDYRRSNICISQFIAHKGSVYTLEWHPDPEEKNTLATGGRDSMVKVWDVLSSRPKEINNVPTTSSVASLRWRPRRKDQLATVSMMLDFTINVWDLRRKYVPFAYFDDHRDTTTGIAWKNNDPDYLFSCSKDGTLFMHNMKESIRPSDNTQTSGFDVSSLGYLGLAGDDKGMYTPRAQSPSGQSNKLPTLFGWKGTENDGLIYSRPSSPTYIGLKMKQFLNARSSLTIFKTSSDNNKFCEDLDDNISVEDTVIEHLKKPGFIFMAKNYKLTGISAALSFKDLCTQNSQIALKAGSPNIARTWLLVGEFYCNEAQMRTNKAVGGVNTSLPRTQSDNATDKHRRAEGDSKKPSIMSRKDDLHGSQILFPVTSGAESEIHSDEGRVEIEDYLTDIARGHHSEPDFYISDDENILSYGYDGATSEADFMTDQEWNTIGIPSEAFEQKEVLDMESIAKFGHVDVPSAVANLSAAKRTILTPHGGRWHETTAPSRVEVSSSPSPPVEGDGMFFSDKDLVVKPSLWPNPLGAIKHEITSKQLMHMARNNDVQTPVSIILALSSYISSDILPLDECDVERWQQSYLDLLAKHQLWVQHAEVVKLSRIPSIRGLSASSTVHFCCRVCQRRMPGAKPWRCDHWEQPDHTNKPVTCFLCNLTVKGLYTYCQACNFGGHFRCVAEWMKKRKDKPGWCENHCI